MGTGQGWISAGHTGCIFSSEDKEEEQDTNDTIDDHCIHRRLSRGVDVFPVFAEREAVVAGVGEGHSASGNHASLAHEELVSLSVLSSACILSAWCMWMTHPSYDSQRQYSHSEVVWHSLHKIGSPWLAGITVQYRINVNDGICDDELQEPAERPTDARREDDSTRRSHISVRALLSDMEWRIVAAECPYDAEEAH